MATWMNIKKKEMKWHETKSYLINTWLTFLITGLNLLYNFLCLTRFFSSYSQLELICFFRLASHFYILFFLYSRHNVGIIIILIYQSKNIHSWNIGVKQWTSLIFATLNEQWAGKRKWNLTELEVSWNKRKRNFLWWKNNYRKKIFVSETLELLHASETSRVA
jgi:hypothetical protein